MAMNNKTILDIWRRIDASGKIVDVCKSIGLAKSTVQTIRVNKKKLKELSQSAAISRAETYLN